MWYNIDWDKLVLLLLPSFLRKPKIFAFIRSAVEPLKALHDDWLDFRDQNIYILNHNGQVCYFRGALNDVFDPDERRIYIQNGLAVEPKHIYTVNENKPIYLGQQPIYLYSSTDVQDTGVDFIINVPQQIIQEQLDRLIAEIERYRQAGKRYKIQAL